MKSIFAAAAIAIALTAGGAIAQAADDGPTIDGNIEMNDTATEDISAAIGSDAKADQELGDVDSGTVDGNIESTVTATEDISAAIGSDSCSDQKVGTVGGNDECK